MREATAFVDVSGLTVTYHSKTSALKKVTPHSTASHIALQSLSFQLAQGDHVTLFGTEASGKSTLIKVLSGQIKPQQGHVVINGQAPHQNKMSLAGQVSSEEPETSERTVFETLNTYGLSQKIENLPARIGEVIEATGLAARVSRPAKKLSTTEQLRLKVARAALSEAPVILLDDIADQIGVSPIRYWLSTIFSGRTTIVATRRPIIAERLGLPILLLHHGRLAQHGTRDEIAMAVACPRVIDAWIEGLRYDTLRKLKAQKGVTSVQLLPTSRFSGQRLRITLRSSRYLPSLYDIISQAPLVRVKEIPPSLLEIIAKL